MASTSYNANTSSYILEGQSTNRPPFFNGTNYSTWRCRMSRYLESIDFDMWTIVLEGFVAPKDNNGQVRDREAWTAEQKKRSMLNSKAMTIIFCSLDQDEFNKVSSCTSAKDMWDILEATHHGTKKKKKAKKAMAVTWDEALSDSSESSDESENEDSNLCLMALEDEFFEESDDEVNISFEELLNNYEKLLHINKKLKHSSKALKKDYEHLRTKHDELSNEHVLLLEKNESLEKVNASLKSLSICNASHEHLEKENVDLKVKMDALTKALAKVSSDKDNLEKILSKQKVENNAFASSSSGEKVEGEKTICYPAPPQTAATTVFLLLLLLPSPDLSNTTDSHTSFGFVQLMVVLIMY